MWFTVEVRAGCFDLGVLVSCLYSDVVDEDPWVETSCSHLPYVKAANCSFKFMLIYTQHCYEPLSNQWGSHCTLFHFHSHLRCRYMIVWSIEL